MPPRTEIVEVVCCMLWVHDSITVNKDCGFPYLSTVTENGVRLLLEGTDIREYGKPTEANHVHHDIGLTQAFGEYRLKYDL